MSLFSVEGPVIRARIARKFNAHFFVLIRCGGDGIQFYEIFCAGRYSNSCMKLLEKKVRMVRHFILLARP